MAQEIKLPLSAAEIRQMIEADPFIPHDLEIDEVEFNAILADLLEEGDFFE